MAECYINLMQFDQARITLNVLLQIIRQNGTENVSHEWNDKINSKLNELLNFVTKSKELNDESRNSGW